MNSTLKGILLAVLVIAIAIVALGATGVIHIPGLTHEHDESCSAHEGHGHAEGETCGQDKPKACTGDHDEDGHKACGGHDEGDEEDHDDDEM